MPQRTRVTRSRSELDSVGLDGISGKKGRAYTYSEEPTPLKSDFRRRTRAATQSLSSASPTLYDHHSRRLTESGRGIGRTGGAWEGSASPTSTISSSSLSSLATASVDPFNLVTFFPTPMQMQMRSEEGSALFGGGEWDWLSEESGVNNKQEYERESEYESNDGSNNMNMGGLFIDIESSDKIRQVGLTDVAGQVIDGEDKFGMLGLSELAFSILFFLIKLACLEAKNI